MSKPSNRQKILTEGMRVVHEHGFGGASVRDIVQAAGVPQGSFTNHFVSKEAFGLEIIDLYFAAGQTALDESLGREDLSPLQRLHTYFRLNRDDVSRNDKWNGCLLGNFSAETSERSPAIRARIGEIFAEFESAFAACLRAAVTAGEVPPDLDCDQVAGFIVGSLQGAMLLAKAQHSTSPFDRFEKILFSRVLRFPGH